MKPICYVCDKKLMVNENVAHILFTRVSKNIFGAIKQAVLSDERLVCEDCLAMGIKKYEKDVVIYQDEINTAFAKKAKIKRWSHEEDIKLKQMFINGMKTSDIAKQLNKSPSSIKTRLWRLECDVNGVAHGNSIPQGKNNLGLRPEERKW